MKIRGGHVSGLAQIKYVVTKYPSPNSGLVFNNQPVVVHKIIEESLDVIEHNLRGTVRSVFPDSVEYDLRALGYCTGRRLALLSVGLPISTSTAPVMRYSGVVDTFNMHDLAATPGVLNANGVLMAYAHLASDCNLERLYAVDDRAQLVAGDQGVRYWLDAYMKVANQLCCDAMRQDMGAIKLAKNWISSKRSKHIEIKYHHIRELVENGEIQLRHVRTECQPADILTKPI